MCNDQYLLFNSTYKHCSKGQLGRKDAQLLSGEPGLLPESGAGADSHSKVTWYFSQRGARRREGCFSILYFLAFLRVAELCSGIERVSGESANSQVLLTSDGKQMEPQDLIGKYSVGTVGL